MKQLLPTMSVSTEIPHMSLSGTQTTVRGPKLWQQNWLYADSIKAQTSSVRSLQTALPDKHICLSAGRGGTGCHISGCSVGTSTHPSAAPWLASSVHTCRRTRCRKSRTGSRTHPPCSTSRCQSISAKQVVLLTSIGVTEEYVHAKLSEC